WSAPGAGPTGCRRSPGRSGRPAAPPWACRSTSPCRSGSARSSVTSRTRSEEHTSELQSRENLVCRLMLEKQKCEESSCTYRYRASGQLVSHATREGRGREGDERINGGR